MGANRARGVCAALLLLLAQPAYSQDGAALIEQARAAAWADRNAEAVTLYEAAFAAAPQLRRGNRREYADQLTYAGRAAEAVPLYRAVLRARAVRAERAAAQRGLALALMWSGQDAAALAAWDLVLATAPGDADARGHRDRLLLEAARRAARADRNAEAAALFGRVVTEGPEPTADLVRDYADQLTYSGQHARAIGLYDRLLATPGISATLADGARRGRALALQWSGQPEPAAAEWRRLLDRNPGDADARRNLTEALIAQARLAAEENRNADAVTLYETVFRLAPDRRPALLLDYAYQLSYAGRSAQAVPLFDEVVRRNELNQADRRGHRGLGQALAWSGRRDQALAAYDRALAKYPDDVGLLNGKAQLLIWMDRAAEAKAVYERALLVAPDDETSIRGAAQSDSYLGRQRLASARLREVIAQGDVSAETMLVAARAEYWKGRPDKAFALADRVLADTPGHSGAQDLIDEIDDSRRPTTSVFNGWSTQSDGLEITTTTARHGMTLGSGLTGAGVQARHVRLNPDTGGNVILQGPGVFLRHRFSDEVEVNSSLHFNTLTGDGFRHREVTHDSWLTYWPNDLLRVDFALSRSYFDDERSLAANILMSSVGVSADFLPVQGTRFSARLQYGDLTDGNSRVFLQLEGHHDLARLPGLDLGGRLTYFGFSRSELDNGYFNPGWLYSTEGTVRYAMDVTDRWRVEASLGLGLEKRANLDKLLWNIGGKATYALTERAALDFEFRHNDHKRVDPVDGFVRTSLGTRLVYKW